MYLRKTVFLEILRRKEIQNEKFPMSILPQPALENLASVGLIIVAALILVSRVRRRTLVFFLLMAALGAAFAQNYMSKGPVKCRRHSTKNREVGATTRIAANLALSVLAFLTRYVEKQAGIDRSSQDPEDEDAEDSVSLESCRAESAPHRPIHFATNLDETPHSHDPRVSDGGRTRAVSNLPLSNIQPPLSVRSFANEPASPEDITARGFHLFEIKKAESDVWQIQTSIGMDQLPKDMCLMMDENGQPKCEYQVEGLFRVLPVPIRQDRAEEALTATSSASLEVSVKEKQSVTRESGCECPCHHLRGGLACDCGENGREQAQIKS
jgi:hypothetical protein